jgi:hypothetical protein
LCRCLKTEFEQCAGQRTGFPNEVKHG